MSGVLFYAPPDMSRASSDTRRHGTNSVTPRNMQVLPVANPDIQLGGSKEKGEFESVNINAMFATFSDELRSSPSSTSPPPLSPSTPNARVPYPDPETSAELYLPILSVAVDVTVDGTVATTELKQRFRNPSQIEIPEAWHTFPLYDGATLTSFVCTIGNKRVLRGVVKPKEEARQTFEKAKKQRREAAALLEELTPEIFETSLGNIPPETIVEVSLTYIHELKVAHVLEGIGLLVTVPTSIAPRYGGLAEATASPKAKDSLEIRLRVIDNGHINANGCHVESGHDAKYEGERSEPQATLPSLEELMGPKPQPQLVWSYISMPPTLSSDFIFFIQMHKTYLLGSRAVLSPADETGWAALMINLRPSDIFINAVEQNSFAGEIIFVLDRSDSMGWTAEGENELKINAMQDAMSLALSGLHDTCAFNIISFGTVVRGLWAQSKAYKDTIAVRKARDRISLLKADMGGTEIFEGIRAAVNSRVQSRASTQVILITDGEVENDDQQSILELIRTTREDLGDRIRFFTLGLGDRVSHHMMEAIADLGGGYCDVVDVVERPRWEDRLNRMLQSAMGPSSWTCDIKLGNRARRRTLMDLNIEADHDPDPLSISYIQAPSPIPPLHPHTYKSIFFLLNLKDVETLNKVTIHTTTPGIKDKTQEVGVEQSKSRTIHCLAVKAALRDMENEIRRGNSETRTARRNAEALGVKNSVSSRWTSFVAVADDDADEQAREVNLYRSVWKDNTINGSIHLDKSGDETSGDDMSGDDMSTHRHRSIHHDHSFGQGLLGERGLSDEEAREALLSPPIRRSCYPVMRSDIAHFASLWHGDRYDGGTHPFFLRQDSELQGMVETLAADPAANKDSDTIFEVEGEYLSGEEKDISLEAEGLSIEVRNISLEEEDLAIEVKDRSVEEEDISVEEEDRSVEEGDLSEPLAEGPITWKDAVQTQQRGLFILPDLIRDKLHQHFCTGTTEQILEKLRRYPACDAIADAEKTQAMLVDTLMMVIYFSTHLAVEEDSWYLIMDKAEHAVQRELGLGENQEDKLQLEALSVILKVSMEHAHFKEALQDSQIDQNNHDKAPAKEVAKTCLVCEKSFGLAEGAEEGLSKGFVCLSDECYASDGRKVWDTWGSFWKHQVDHGHLLCF